MRLYILEDNKKIYINQIANTRRDLYYSIGSFEFRLELSGNHHNINEVVAEYDDNIIIGTILGALVGIFFGFIGIGVGAVAGYIIEMIATTKDKIKADNFNNSIVSYE